MQQTNKIYQGVIVPMITPLRDDWTVDEEATQKILQSLLEANNVPFVLGTTGESASLSQAQKMSLVKTTVNYMNQRRIVFAGISGNCLPESVDQAKAFADLGVDVLVAHLPFYYPLSADQMIRYFEQLAEAVSCPLVLYNMPGTVKQSISMEVLVRLSDHQNIVGVKDSERSRERIDASVQQWKHRADFAYYLGWAAQSAYALGLGADGVVPSTGNLTPQLYSELYEMIVQGKSSEAESLQHLTNRISAIYQQDKTLSESIPALKALMSASGLCNPFVMPPMYALEREEMYQMTKMLEGELQNQNRPLK